MSEILVRWTSGELVVIRDGRERLALGEAMSTTSEDGLTWLRKFGTSVRGPRSTSVVHDLTVGNISLWWWFEHWLYHPEGLLDWKSCWAIAAACENIISDDCARVRVEGAVPIELAIGIRGACAERGVPCVVNAGSHRFALNPVRSALRWGKALARKAWIQGSERRKEDRLGSVEVLVESGVTWRASSGGGSRNVYFGGLFDELRKCGVSFRYIETCLGRSLHLGEMREQKAVAPYPYDAIEKWMCTSDVVLALHKARQLGHRVEASGAPYDKGHGASVALAWHRLRYFRRWVLPYALVVTQASRRMLEETAPACVLLTGESNFFGLGLLAAANALAVPTVAVQHGVMDPQLGDYRWESAGGRNTRPLADMMAVYGEWDRHVAVQVGGWPGPIAVVGSSRWEDMLSRAGRIGGRAAARTRLGLPLGLPLIVCLSQPLETDQERRAFEQVVASAMAERLDWLMVVKLHPSEAVDGRRWHSALARVPHIVLGRVAMEDLLIACDVVVTAFSTALIEAAVLGRPGIVVDPLHKGYARLFSSVESVSTPAELGALLSSFDPEGRAFASTRALAAAHAGPLDGRSSARLASVLQDAVRNGVAPCSG